MSPAQSPAQSPGDAYASLVADATELAVLQSCASVLGWDQQTYMPKAGGPFRGEQLALLAKLCHAKATDPRVGERLAVVEGSDLARDPDSETAANVREWRHGYDRATKLSSRLVEELARVTTAAQEAWVLAKGKSDFPLFEPHLEKIVGLKREEAQAVQSGMRNAERGGKDSAATPNSELRAPHLIDALLDEYEPGCTTAELRPLFASLTAELVPFIKAIGDAKKQPDESVLRREFPVDRQKWFAESIAAAFGFDFNAGRLDTTSHPFCSAFGPGDCRLTTRYSPRFFSEAFFGVLHEAGHGMYEQGLPADRFGTPCGTYCSLGVHESQSRFWENLVGRGRAFWQHALPRLQQAFPGTVADVDLDRWHFAVNAVKPTLIRVEADEATYNLHVAIRFELELALIGGELQVADLPAAWNDKYEAFLGIRPKTDAEGCLQDIHWSFGGFGYFPTYTLGNLHAAHYFAHMPDPTDAIRRGEFRDVLGWLRTNVHGHGRRYRSGELTKRATGTPLTAEAFSKLLRTKLGGLYGV